MYTARTAGQPEGRYFHNRNACGLRYGWVIRACCLKGRTKMTLRRLALQAIAAERLPCRRSLTAGYEDYGFQPAEASYAVCV
ncbi:MAG: hypothetical protein LBP64_06340 [Tannerella sp.]|jgi:hypothetical protein|nr:hypothetical protein [Tannerella sp.]